MPGCRQSGPDPLLGLANRRVGKADEGEDVVAGGSSDVRFDVNRPGPDSDEGYGCD